MRRLVLGGITTLAIVALCGMGLATLGFIPTNANAPPPAWERHIAMAAVDASMERHAPRVTNPLSPTDANVMDGMKLYTMNCAVCHGTLDRKPAPLAHNFYPPVPNLVSDPPDDPEWHVFYTIRTGVRYTGMPAWEGVLPEQDMWKITTFLSHMDKLSPAVQDYWKNSFGAPTATDKTTDKATDKAEEKPATHDKH